MILLGGIQVMDADDSKRYLPNEDEAETSPNLFTTPSRENDPHPAEYNKRTKQA
jgi:hypothetical protein